MYLHLIWYLINHTFYKWKIEITNRTTNTAITEFAFCTPARCMGRYLRNAFCHIKRLTSIWWANRHIRLDVRVLAGDTWQHLTIQRWVPLHRWSSRGSTSWHQKLPCGQWKEWEQSVLPAAAERYSVSQQKQKEEAL